MGSLFDPANMIPLPGVPTPAIGGARTGGLAFVLEQQQEAYWCWAAVATSIAMYYGAGSAWTQCALANAELGQTTCCEDGGTGECNVPWYLDRALERVAHLRSVSMSKAAWAEVTREIDAARPICARIGWSGGGGHFVVVGGYDSAAGMIDVKDPFYGDSSVAHGTFPGSYLGGGSWTHSYTTQ